MPTQDQTATDTLTIDSDALKANLLETATDKVAVDPSLAVLGEIVSKFKGISKNLDELLYEVCHPYRNWNMLVPRLRAFVLKNFSHYLNHEKGPQAFDRFSIIFFQAMIDSKKNKTLIAQIIESLVAYTDKLISNMDHEKLMLYEKVFNTFFSRLFSLEEDIVILMVQGQHPMKRTASRLLDMEKEQPAYDFKPLAMLMKRTINTG
jgi:pyruvate,orthophosphate dikinase